MTTLDVAATRLAVALAAAGCPPITTGTLANLATWARDYGADVVAGWIAADPGWIIAPSINTNHAAFRASLLTIGRFKTNGPEPQPPKEVGP